MGPLTTYPSRDSYGAVRATRWGETAFPSPIREQPSSPPWRDKKVAMVHDWCPSFRGGERVLAQFCKLFPGADVFTLFDFLPGDIKDEFFPGTVFHTSGANRLPM